MRVFFQLWNQIKIDGTGYHTEREIVDLLRQDLASIAALRKKGTKFLLSDDEASNVC